MDKCLCLWVLTISQRFEKFFCYFWTRFCPVCFPDLTNSLKKVAVENTEAVLLGMKLQKETFVCYIFYDQDL